MLRTGYGLVILILLALVMGGCSSSNSDAPLPSQVHPDGWLAMHPSDPNAAGDAADCALCHGVDFKGSGRAVSCFDCHLSGPPFSIHPSWWVVSTLEDHQCFFNVDDPAQRLSWTGCATANCHGTDLQGGALDVPTGPGCFNSSCHATEPPVPHAMPFTDPTLHGPEAKDVGGNNTSMGNYCINCHGRPQNSFDGGYVSDPAILNNANGACTLCHTDATAHPTNWVKDNNPTYYHSPVSDQTKTGSCALCHNIAYAGAGPMPGAPSCFSATFTNANGLANSCHPTGPGGAPHAVPFTNPALHGPAAKTDLVFCQSCHGSPGGAGSNPTFNVPIGSLVNGCEDCHPAGAAHPGEDGERWTFRHDTTQPRYTHFASGNVTTACALCHNVSAGDSGGTAPACTGCHTAPAAPGFALDCTACHGTPPITGSTDLTGATVVDHGAAAGVALHEVCALCHGTSDDGSGALVAKTTDYQLFNANDPLLNEGGDHLDGRIEMNGPAGVGTAYNPATLGCDIACHANDAAHQLPNSSTLPIAYGNYGSGSAACDTCHGYPPTGGADIAPVPVSHLFGDNGATLLSSHGDCLVCHGDKDDGTGSHSPTGNYDVATDHANGSINMNLDTQYNEGNRGCDAACHVNDAAHQFPNNSGFTVVLDSYGSGGAGSCAGCHDTGVGGAPIVIANTTSHTTGYTCEECHTAHGQGTVIIPNNAEAGIAYPASGHLSGISLGSATVPGATEAQICWTCHDTSGVSEWGTNTDTNGTANNYDFGTLSQSNWVGANWDSANFTYKSGPIASTHAADFSAAGPGVDAVGDIHCSYCHDVHNVGAQGLRNGYDNGGNPPYLMGTWMGNPYREDGAPQSGTTYSSSTNGRFGAVPRPGTQATTLGGYQIDQNNGDPTALWTANSSAGLCEYCHGDGNGSWSSAEIDSLNEFGLASDDWVGTNGHSNAVLGGSGAGASDIFNMNDTAMPLATRRNPNGAPLYTGSGSAKGYPRQAYGNAGSFTDPVPSGDNSSSYRGYGLRSQDSSGYRMSPQVTSSEPYAYRAYNWGASVDNTIDSKYHQFSCSKCHNPHASRLPRLMITNCLDTKHNTWDDTRITPSIATLAPENISVPLSNATSAQNCHRLRDPGYGNTTGGGWNNVTPW